MAFDPVISGVLWTLFPGFRASPPWEVQPLWKRPTLSNYNLDGFPGLTLTSVSFSMRCAKLCRLVGTVATYGLSKEVNDWLLLGGKPAAELAAKANPQAVTHVLPLD